MSQEQMRSEIMYQMSRNMLDGFLCRGWITEEEYSKIDQLNKKKFMPLFAQVSG